MDFLTDWSNTDPHYFYLRGALWGLVMATLLWTVVVPWVREKLNRRSSRHGQHDRCSYFAGGDGTRCRLIHEHDGDHICEATP